MSRRLVALLGLALALSACGAGTPIVAPAPSATPLRSDQTNPASRTPFLVSLTPTITALPASPTPVPPTPTQTPIPCDPVKGYCIENGHFYFDRPIALPGTITIDRGYPYGTTEGGTREPHHGVEFYNASGTPVLAAADGVVAVAGNDSQTIYAVHTNSYGNLIVLEHHFPGIDEAVYTVYGHLSKVEVQVGQTVRAGDEIGKVGATGAAIGSHLHFEVRLGQNTYDSNRNPVLWLKPLDGADGTQFGALAGRLVDAQGNPLHVTDMNIQYFPDRNGPQAAAYQMETYAPEAHPVRSDDTWNENFAMSDIPAGNYRISKIWGGRLYEDWIVVEPGKVTFFVFQIGQ
ncbi:MAG TPA: M23 family metallopeptidase [Anaerolineales bacterium]|nr:M23 family metallopeptidase [Anaerolineales bacterium]